jgi:hypothetical protein
MFNYDKLSEQLWELSKFCPKEYEAKLMELSAIINKLKELENA